MTIRPNDYGSQFPSDAADQAPADPSGHYAEIDYDVSGLKAKTLKLQQQSTSTFEPIFRLPDYAPNLKTSWYGVVSDNQYTASDSTIYIKGSVGPGYYNVTRQDGKSVTILVPTVHYQMYAGNYCLVFELQDPTEILGRTGGTPNYMGFPMNVPTPRYAVKIAYVQGDVASQGFGTAGTIAGAGDVKFFNWTNGTIKDGETVVFAWSDDKETYLPISANCTT